MKNSPYTLAIVSDTICPWCYICKRRLDAALDLIGDEFTFDVRWCPFELNPDMPREGLNRKTYRSRKFGGWEKSLVLDTQVKTAGDADGLDFHHDRMAMTPNTLASHVLIRLSGEADRQDETVEALFKAYFTDGQDIGDIDVLVDIGAACGLDHGQVTTAMNEDRLRIDIRSEARAFAQASISGVPTVMLNRHILFSGAQAPEVIASSLRQAAARDDIIAAGAKGATRV